MTGGTLQSRGIVRATVMPRGSRSGDALVYVNDTQSSSIGELKVVTSPSMSASVTVSVTDWTHAFGGLGENEIAWLETSRRACSATLTAKDSALDANVPKPLLDGQLLEPNAQIVAIDTPRERFLKIVEDEPEEEPGLIFVSHWRQDGVRATPAQRER